MNQTSPPPQRLQGWIEGATRTAWRRHSILFAAAAVSFLPAWLDFLHGHDAWSHLSWYLGFYDVLREGVLYPRWLPDVNQGDGGPLFVYYGPTFAYLTSAFASLVGIVGGMKLAAFASWWGAGAAMYGLARVHWDHKVSLVAGLAYLLSPYHFYALYERAAFAESVQFVFCPLVILGVLRAEKGGGRLNFIFLSMAVAGSIVTHVVTASILLYLVAAYCVWRLLANRKAMFTIGAAIGLGVVLAAVYLLPAALQKPWINPIFLETHWNYRNNLLLRTPATTGAADSQLWTWWMVALMACLLGALALARRNAEPGRDANRTRIWRAMMAAGVFVIFMTTSISEPVWKLPGLEFVMFPMRWLLMGSLAAGLLLGAVSACGWKPGWAAGILCVALGANLMMAGGIWGRRARDAYRHRHEWQVNPATIEAARYRSEITAPPAWVPDLENRLMRNKRTDGPLVSILPDSPGQAEALEWNATTRKVGVSAVTGARIELRTFFFPPWKCQSAPGELPVEPSPRGRLLVRVPPGETVVECRYTRQPSEAWGAVLSLAGLAVVLLLAGCEMVARFRSTSLAANPR
jgi:hypothetical protein